MRLIALLFCPFAFTTGAFVFSGVLEPMANEIGVSVATAATLQSAFAISCALCGPPLAYITRGWPRRPLLLAVLAILTLLNAASALTQDFSVLFVLRMLAGGLGSLAFPLATGFAASGARPEERVKAVSTVYAGIPLALIVGIPLGSLVGNLFGWPASFILVTGICAIAFAMVSVFVPTATPQWISRAAAARQPRTTIIVHLATTLVASTALFCLVGLIGPTIRVLTGFGGLGIAAVQLVAGLSSLLGVRLGAALAVSRARFGPAVPFCLLFVSLGVVVWPLTSEVVTAFTISSILLSVAFGPAAQSATGTIIQSRLAELVGAGATFVFSLNGSMIYLGQGLGIVLGAIASEQGGLAAAPLTGVLLTLPGFLIALVLGRISTDDVFKEA